MKDLQKISKLIKITRKANGITQKELAKAMTVTQSYISEVENGNTTPTPMFIKLFCLMYSIDEKTVKEYTA